MWTRRGAGMNAQGDRHMEAADWFVRLQSDLATEADWTAFQAWLDYDSGNGAAYNAVEAVWVELDEFNPEVHEALAPMVTAISGRRVKSSAAKLSRRTWAMAAAASIVLSAGAAAYYLSAPGATEIYSTARGETRLVSLADGTNVHLNGGSRISVRLGRHIRNVEMADAQAVFDVAKDPDRPFVITAGDRQVRVVGTEFDVLHQDGNLRVTVRRGVVDVLGARFAAAPVRLNRGQQLFHKDGATTSVVRSTDPDSVLAWSSGRLVYNDEPLSRVAADLSRAFSRPVVVDRTAAGLRFSGVLQLDAEEAVIGRLEAFLPVRAERSDDLVRLVRSDVPVHKGG